MANIKISQLDPLTPPDAADLVPVVDTTAPSSTKRTTVGEIVGIVNGDVEVASDGTATISGLPVSKLQDGDARQLLQTAANGTDVEWTDDVDIPGTLDVTGATTLDSTLGVNGQSTLDGDVVITGDLTVSSNEVEHVKVGTSEVVFNDGGENYDFRIEGDTVSNLFFVDASADKVGLGTSSPSEKLEVATNSGVNGISIRAENYLSSSSSYGANIKLYCDQAAIWTGTREMARIAVVGGGLDHRAGNLGFFVKGGAADSSVNERMRINSAGELLVGYTSDNGAYKLQVNSQIFATSATIATSDGRYKENVAALDGCVDLVKALRPVSFDWKAQEPVTRVDEDGETVVVREAHNFPDGKQVGFIAQEVEEVLADKPWLGSVIKQNVRPAVTDVDGNELAPEEEFLGIAEGNLVAVLTSALQEAIGRIETLEAEVAALKAQ